MQAKKPTLPPFRSLLKSTEVEDPVNICVHRPLAYAFVWSIFRTPITPNGVTLMAILAGLASGAFFLSGTPTAMIAAGALLWTAAILDGADGILARAKGQASQFGRALDGAADVIVAVATVFPAFAHLYFKDQNTTHLWLMGPAIGLTAVHLWLYDFYKENYLRRTRLDRGGEGEDPEQVARLVESAKAKGAITHFAVKHVLLPYVQTQQKIIRLLDPLAVVGRNDVARNEKTAAIYRRHNQGPMRLWAIVSLAPHSYLMAICAMCDRLDVYLYLRLFGMNAIFLVAALWQRRATRATVDDLRDIGALPPEDSAPSETLATGV
tara:strand:- start:2386 stop:3354 length:969 start_codon:yes stop_codon:yes gene_type:complete